MENVKMVTMNTSEDDFILHHDIRSVFIVETMNTTTVDEYFQKIAQYSHISFCLRTEKQWKM